MIPMKNLKSTKGFTLVELIVVIAILGILAAVAVPAYTGYIKKADEAADTQIISAINTALQSAAAGQGKEAKDIIASGEIGLESDNTAKIVVTEAKAQSDVALFLKNAAYPTGGVVVGPFKYYTKLNVSTAGLVTGVK